LGEKVSEKKEEDYRLSRGLVYPPKGKGKEVLAIWKREQPIGRKDPFPDIGEKEETLSTVNQLKLVPYSAKKKKNLRGGLRSRGEIRKKKMLSYYLWEKGAGETEEIPKAKGKKKHLICSLTNISRKKAQFSRSWREKKRGVGANFEEKKSNTTSVI